MILPFVFLRQGIHALFTSAVPKKFTSNCLFASEVSVCSIAPEMPNPAQLMTRSSLFSRAMTASTAERTLPDEETSQSMWRIPSSPFPDRENSYTRYPFPDSLLATQEPIPELPPVTMATFSI